MAVDGTSIMNNTFKKSKCSFVRADHSVLVSELLSQRRRGEFCDVKILVNGIAFPAHRAILASSCLYFRSMFTDDDKLGWKEHRDNEINLSDSLNLNSIESFEEVLDYFYTSRIVIYPANVEDLMRLSDFFLLEELKEFITCYFLNHGNITLSNCLYLCIMADRYQFLKLYKTTRKIVECRFADYFIFSEHILELPMNYFRMLLNDKVLMKFVKTSDVAQCVINWANFTIGRMNSENLNNLLECLNLQSWSLADLKLLKNNSSFSNINGIHEKISYFINSSSNCNVYKKRPTRPNSLMLQKTFSPALSVKRPRSFPGEKLCSSCQKKCTYKQLLPVLPILSQNVFYKQVLFLFYDVTNHKWLELKIQTDISKLIPDNAGIASLCLQKNKLYCLLLPTAQPYPMLLDSFDILTVDIASSRADIMLYKIGPAYSRELTKVYVHPSDLRPAVVTCRGYVITTLSTCEQDCLALCDTTLLRRRILLYNFPRRLRISSARAVTFKDKQIFLWSRCEVTDSPISFFSFDMDSRTFMEFEPPAITSDEFLQKAYLIWVDNDDICVGCPNEEIWKFDVNSNIWRLTEENLGNIEMTPGHEMTKLEVLDGKIYVLQTWTVHATSLCFLNNNQPEMCKAVPTDAISVITSGYLEKDVLKMLSEKTAYDESLANMFFPSGFSSQTPTATPGSCGDSDISDTYFYDEELDF